jgi:estrogen-related receptor beta like 1
MLESKVDASEWKLELERVAPQLRVTVVADGKDWRAHLDQTHAHQVRCSPPPTVCERERES